MIDFVGSKSVIKRIEIGWHSFDKALTNTHGDLGFPLGGIAEVYGASGVGKSTFCYSLAGNLSKQLDKFISLADFEGYDGEFMSDILSQVGFEGTVFISDAEEDEKRLDEFILSLKEKDGVGILDSVGAISPISELGGSLGEANMGRRAKLMSQFCRKAIHLSRMKSKSFLAVNHMYQNIGGVGYMYTPGGKVLEYMSHVRIQMSKEQEFNDGSYSMKGKITKNKFGKGKGEFYVFVLSGKGVNKQLTWLYDAYKLDLIKVERGIVRIPGEDSGTRISSYIDMAHNKEYSAFDVFKEILDSHAN